MNEGQSKPRGPDFVQGIDVADLVDGRMLLGHVNDDAILLARRGNEVFAVDAFCTHYGGPLAEGLFVEDTVRCPWHHACFSLRTGAALRPPALNPIMCWKVERQGDRVFVRKRAASPQIPEVSLPANVPDHIVILGGGAAGNSAAETLRTVGYAGKITIVSADSSVPYDRPNLSKDYLSGNAPEDWIPLRSLEFYRECDIELRLGTAVIEIDTERREVRLENGNHLSYDTLLLATGAEPVRLDVSGGDLPHVHYLRSLDDSRRIIQSSKTAQHAVVVGASFIGLEVAAALRARNIHVQVVAPESVLMSRILGSEVGTFIRELHEEHDVRFHLNTTVSSIEDKSVSLKTGETLLADLVVVGIGVRPAIGLAEKAGLTIDDGIVVDEYLQTSVPGIFAAGDVARWPDPHTGEKIRVEHWVVAQRQGQFAARNMLGLREPFDAVPFFWSAHYDVAILYVGHAENWDKAEIDGQLSAKDCSVKFWRSDKLLAVATMGRDSESLFAEVELEAQLAE